MSVIPENVDSLSIITYPHPGLRQQAEVVDPTDPAVARLVKRMIELLYTADGVGIAATQLGVPARVFVANPTREPGNEIVVINPEVVETEGWQETEEGCLSLPGITLKLRRRQRVKLQFADLAGQVHVVDAADFLATIFQHEGDHLDGRLIIDRAGEVGRRAIRDAIRKLEEQFEPSK